MSPTPEIRAKVLKALQQGATPIEVARTLKLSLVTITEIADPKGKSVQFKRPQPRMR
jgi:hypothetical protein